MTASEAKRTFGSTVRRARAHRQIGLRQFAKMVGVSPTYQSKIERDELPPPAEDKVVKMAELLGQDHDELLALANRVASDVTEIIKAHPRELAPLLRSISVLSPSEVAELTEWANALATVYQHELAPVLHSVSVLSPSEIAELIAWAKSNRP